MQLMVYISRDCIEHDRLPDSELHVAKAGKYSDAFISKLLFAYASEKLYV